MFVGRTWELKTLEDLYQKNSFQMVVIYGRRRVGKTSLISQFVQDKQALFFSAEEGNDRLNLEIFSRLIYHFFDEKALLNLPPFPDWEKAFRFLAERIKDKRIILAFWYRFIFTNRSAVDAGRGKVLLQAVLADLNAFTGSPFETVCMQYLNRFSSRLPFNFVKAGRWWGSNPVSKSAEEIDLVCSDYQAERAIFAECKWRNEQTAAAVLQDLLRKSALVTGFRQSYYFLFSKSGFTKGCRELAASMGNVKLIGLEDLFAVT
jgi:AAA+ ATPase superfamily predicted ATPase